jgi:hypothetical protein
MPLNFGTNVVNSIVFNGNRVRALRYGEPIVWTKPSVGLAFTLNSDATYTVSGIGSCTDTDIVIPATYLDKPVTAIANSAFYYNKTITSVIIPSTITTIGTYAFYYSEQLKSVVIGENLTTANNAVVTIKDRAFGICKNLTSVILGCAVNLAGDSIFSNAEKLTDLIINPAVTITGESAFDNCTSLRTVSLPNYASTGEYTFNGCTSLTSVTLPSTIKSIDEGAFRGCTALTSVSLPSALTTIGQSAFDTTGLTSISIPKSVTSLGYAAFGYCNALTSVSLTTDSTLTSIGKMCFTNCSALTALNFPATLKTIGDQAFHGSGLTGTINIPKSVTSIGKTAFGRCSSLSAINVASDNSNYKSTNGVLFDKAGCTLLQYPEGKTTAAYSIPSGVTTIAESAMSFAPFTSITVPTTLTTIKRSACTYAKMSSFDLSHITILEQSAFSNCTNLTSVYIPDAITSIATDVFRGCTKLSTVTGCKNVTLIQYDTFRDCAITSFPFKPALTEIWDRAFYNCIKLPIATALNDTSLSKIGKGTFGYDTGKTPSNRESVALPATLHQIGVGALPGIKYATLPRGTWRVTYGNLQVNTAYPAFTVNNTTTQAAIATFLTDPAYYTDNYICKQNSNNGIILTADSEGDLFSVGVTGPEDLSGPTSCKVEFFTQSYDEFGTVGNEGSSYTLRTTTYVTVDAGETVTVYFTNSPTYYIVRAVASISGYSANYLTEVNESYDPDATGAPEYTTT